MAMLSNLVTLADVARTRPDSDPAKIIINAVSQYNPVLAAFLTKEGSTDTGNQVSVLSGLPTVYFRSVNAGVPSSKTTSTLITDSWGEAYGLSQPDRTAMEIGGEGQVARNRLFQDAGYMESLGILMGQQIFYGNPATNNGNGFLGLSGRYSTLQTALAANAANVIDAGGTGSTNTSMWFIQTGERHSYLFYPKGSSAGIKQIDNGAKTIVDQNTGLHRPVYETEFFWRMGLSVPDWRFIVRVCNIDVTTLLGPSAPNLINALVRAVERWPVAGISASPVQTSGTGGATPEQNTLIQGRGFIAVNRVIGTALRLAAMNKSNVLLRIEEIAGKPFLMYSGYPILVCDAILNTEARVV